MYATKFFCDHRLTFWRMVPW